MSVEAIERLAEEVGGTVTYDYSGRCMFGKKCVGIIAGYIDELIEKAQDEGMDDYSTDKMGLDHIVYWPNITQDQIEPDYVKDDIEQDPVADEGPVEPVADEDPVEPVADVPEQEEIKLTEKQRLIMDTLKKNEIGAFVTKDLVDFVEGMNARSITGVVSSLKKKGLLVKSANGSWTLTELGKSV